MAGMVRHAARSRVERPALGLTMFGVTTPCVTAVRRALEDRGYRLPRLPRHRGRRPGHGGAGRGRADPRRPRHHDHRGGRSARRRGLPCGPDRFEPILEAGIPYVLSLGRSTWSTSGPWAPCPEPFRNRKLHVHNAQVTLMRTTPEENRAFARWIAAKLNHSVGPLTVLIPEKGVSGDRCARTAVPRTGSRRRLFNELERAVKQTVERRSTQTSSPHQRSRVCQGTRGRVPCPRQALACGSWGDVRALAKRAEPHPWRTRKKILDPQKTMARPPANVVFLK